MTGVWVKVSNIWQYKYTEGEHMKANKLRVPEAGKKVYEKVAPKEMKEDRNHIVIYHGEKKIVDSNVPQFAKRASHSDSVTRLVYGFTVSRRKFLQKRKEKRKRKRK